MDVSLWMTRDLVVLAPESTLADATRLMASHGVRHLPVVESKTNRIVGMVSSQEILLATEPGLHPKSPRATEAGARRSVRDFMAKVGVAVRSDVPIEEAARILRDQKLGALPVVDHGVLVGILTDHDLLRAFLELSGADDAGYEVTLELTDAADTVAQIAELGRRHRLQIASIATFRHERRRLGLVRLMGSPTDAFLDEVWHTCRVLRVRSPREPAEWSQAPK